MVPERTVRFWCVRIKYNLARRMMNDLGKPPRCVGNVERVNAFIPNQMHLDVIHFVLIACGHELYVWSTSFQCGVKLEEQLQEKLTKNYIS